MTARSRDGSLLRVDAEEPTGFSAYAVRSRSGPHVSMQAGVLHAGRFWTTTSAASLKARSVRAHRTACVVVDDGGRLRVVAGRTNRVRPLRPLDALRDPVVPLRSTSAVVRLGLGQVEQLIGYFEAAGRVPPDWLPMRRVLLVTRVDRSITFDGYQVVDATGDWERTVGAALEPAPGAEEALPLGHLPETHAHAVRDDRRAHVGLDTSRGPVVLPATWSGANRFDVPAGALRAVDAVLPGRAVAVFDESGSRRPDEKLGVMFRGSATLADLDGQTAAILVHTERVTTWDGFRADTVPVDP